MRAFAALYEALDATTGTNAKVQAMATYFRAAAPADAAWALYFLTGRRLKRFISCTSPEMSSACWNVGQSSAGIMAFSSFY